MGYKSVYSYDSVRGQCVMLLLGALKEMGGKRTKREVLDCIAERHYFDVETEDGLPFPTHIQDEPRWEVLMSAVFPDCLKGSCIRETEGGLWELTRQGEKLYSQTRKQLQNGTFDPRQCFLWTREFKMSLVPKYRPQPEDRCRPSDLYEIVRRRLARVALMGATRDF